MLGILLGKLIFTKDNQKNYRKQRNRKNACRGKIKSRYLQKERELEAKERFVQLKSDHEKELMHRSQKVAESENRIKQKSKACTVKKEAWSAK